MICFICQLKLRILLYYIHKLTNKHIIITHRFYLGSQSIMGNANCCNQSSQKLGGGFSNISEFQAHEMISCNDPALEKNLLQNKTHAPPASIAKKADKRPKVFYLIEDSKKRQFSQRPINKPQTNGVELPCYYITKYQAYYEGQWLKGMPHGFGKLYFKNGSYFQGSFQNGQISGSDGILFYPDGSFKRGNVVGGKLQGYGRFVARSGNFYYQGQWKNDQPNGRGVQIYPDGSRYQGQFINGKKNDSDGSYRWPNGKVYKGPFRDGFMQGNGRLYMENGKGQYIGQFHRNLKIGHGRMKTQTGQYSGAFENGEMHGQGTFKWYDGKTYQGEFQNGQMHGNGIMYFPNGQMAKGTWHHGENLNLDLITAGRSQLRS